ncbi:MULTISPECIES: dihydrodipicolinate reductase [Thermomonospora]|uniref:Dihydrodipicolinate reductase n=1 Tax=Thermomonospora curvata (strain ATCC 19995 / DSM 43183 / JCM 3096 / KCTC 9072 / NBRC 15933 / NCIMB 10081 / Henssen B9) TaxID=471852 RepID=D1ACE7_THECD|nr:MULTISPECIES: dihydrodipicolinate reductase [Thermomonospora]ACY99206.1 dihydrodipicolinate reductase [Thermomonospora curvata DSM 43183]PKK13375.1 MAG: dihydrodipicolinate reductase [Thermomonospora sp. CIF 1]
MGPYRVVQWATGALGRSAIRAVLERPDMQLVGARVYDPAKAGVDVAELAGRPPIGVPATADPEQILALDADCVIFAPSGGVLTRRRSGGLNIVCELLASGKNVICLSGLVYPQAHGPELVDELERACRAGNSSVHGTGVNPGFMADLMPLALSRLSRQISHVYARECSDFSGHPSWRLVHDMVGFGKTEEEYVADLRKARAYMRSVFTESMYLVAAALGVALDEVDCDVAYRLASEDFDVSAGHIAKGTVAAARWTLNGLVKGNPFIMAEAIYKADASRVFDWGDPGYAVRVHGRPSITLTTGEDWVSNGIAAAAAHAVNAVPAVCEAEPGIRTLLDLPLITGRAAAPYRST